MLFEAGSADWEALRKAAFAWDPLGVGRLCPRDEYDCIIKEIVPLLEHHAGMREVVARVDAYWKRYRVEVEPGIEDFARSVVVLWMKDWSREVRN